jgi:putative methyltransferase (TIGR04325 family)
LRAWRFLTLKTLSIANFPLLSAVHSLMRYIKHTFSRPELVFAPEGWKTVIPGDDTNGWNSTSVVDCERAKWEKFLDALKGAGPLGFNHEHYDLSINDHVPFHNINMTYGYVLSLSAHQKSILTVLDYGGGLGHYYQIGRTLLPNVDLVYACKEVWRMAEAGKQLNPEIHWHTNDTCLATTYDLVIIGGSLQYIEQWQNLLRTISASVGEYLYLTGIPVTDTCASFVAIQLGYGKRMLHWQFNKEELLKVLTDTGLNLVREFVLENCPYIKNAPSQCKMRGWLFKK